MTRVKHFPVLIGIIGLFLMSACQPLVDHDQPRRSGEHRYTLSHGQSIGQTFVAQHGGLSGVEFWLSPGRASSGKLVFTLRPGPESSENLRTVVIPVSESAEPVLTRFTFDPVHTSHGTYYYGFVTFEGEGEVDIETGPGNAYLHGALYANHSPEDAQVAFRLSYDVTWTLVELMGASIREMELGGVALLLYIVPGWALVAWFLPGGKLLWVERLALAVGLSLALYPLLFLWTDLVRLRLGALIAWLPALAGIIALVWRYRDWRPSKGWEALRHWVRSQGFWPEVTLLVSLVLIFSVRLLTVRMLDAPMWGDSYQHTTMAQLLVDQGGLFDSWEPYAALRSFTYHFGFHAAVAVFHWVSGQSMPQAVISVGQFLNGFAVLTVYLLAYRIGKDRWGATLAVLLVGLLSPMPMYYVNWGRYTQLTGLVILPAAVWLSWLAFESRKRDWHVVGLSWLAVGGLALTHYRVLIFYVIFVLAWWVLSLGQNWRGALSRVTLVGLGSALFFLPWFVHIAGGKILANFSHQLTTSAGQVSGYMRQYNAVGNLTTYLAPWGWLLLFLAIGWALWQRKRGALLIIVWWSLLLVATNPMWVHLPGSGAISNFAYFIAVYLPWGVLSGVFLGALIARWMSLKAGSVLVTLGVIAIGLIGARDRLADIKIAPHSLVTRPDVRAMDWIRVNTARDARFLVNSFFAYGGSVVVGSDAGWWLPLLTGRANTVPPLNYGTERGPDPGYRLQVNEVTAQIQQAGLEDPETLALLEARGITHVYVGQQQGRVNYRGPHVLDPVTMRESPHYRPIYHRDRVWIFEVLP